MVSEKQLNKTEKAMLNFCKKFLVENDDMELNHDGWNYTCRQEATTRLADIDNFDSEILDETILTFQRGNSINLEYVFDDTKNKWILDKDRSRIKLI